MTAPATTLELVVRVVGTPGPQGSKSYKGTRNGRAILVESSKKAKPWRRDVETACASAIKAWEASSPERVGMWFPLDGPLEFSGVFYLHKPGRPMNDDWPITYPDLSKLIRSTEDAMKLAGVMRDDARIVRFGTVEKRYADPGQPTGATIRVRAISEQGALL